MLQFEEFVSILNSLYNLDIQAIVSEENRNRRIMVFGDFDDNRANAVSRIQAFRTANCVRVLGKGVIRVVHRVDDAKENNNLDLSDCQLMMVPDAIYFMMRNTQLTACNLSSNVITKIPPKFPTNFNFITELNLSQNRMSTLPEEISGCTQLETVDISHNSFISVPACLFALPSIVSIIAKKNFIADVDVEVVAGCNTLENLNLEENPLSRDCQANLATLTSVRVIMTTRDLEEWEDLSI